MRALFGLILVGVSALVGGLIGFQAGIASNIGAAGGAVYLGGGFPGFGFLFFLFFVGFLFFAFAGRRRGPWGMHGGHGRWGETGEGDPRRQWMADAHRRLHEEDARTGTTGTTGSTGLPGTPGTTGSAAG